MAYIANKSNHPILVKKIELKLWKLRDEIEACIEKKITEQVQSEGPAHIDDIKEFYLSALTVIQGPSVTSETDENLDSSGNPIDDDAKAMMEALGGESGAEQAPETEQEASEASPEDSSEATSDEEEDEAAKMAREMLEGQGEDEAAKMAREMLEGQGEDQALDTLDKTTEQNHKNIDNFERIRPKHKKVFSGFTLLSDINMDSILLFGQDSLTLGQNIVIEFTLPEPFSQLVEVYGIKNISRQSRIISDSRPKYRIFCKFLFKFPGERARLRSFLQSIEPEIPKPTKKAEKKKEDDDDFDDLGF